MQPGQSPLIPLQVKEPPEEPILPYFEIEPVGNFTLLQQDECGTGYQLCQDGNTCCKAGDTCCPYDGDNMGCCHSANVRTFDYQYLLKVVALHGSKAVIKYVHNIIQSIKN